MTEDNWFISNDIQVVNITYVAEIYAALHLSVGQVKSCWFSPTQDRLCGLVVRVSAYRSRSPGSIPGATRFSEKCGSLERGPLSLVATIEELLGRKSSGSGLESRDYGRRDPPRWLREIPLSTKVGTDFVDKRRPLGRNSSIEDSGNGVFFFSPTQSFWVPGPLGSWAYMSCQDTCRLW
jgi:hypothetical protein